MRPARFAPRRPPRTLAERLTLYIDDMHDGNLTTACAALGVPYHQLWRAARGRTDSPSAALLLALATHTGRPIEWWLAGRKNHA